MTEKETPKEFTKEDLKNLLLTGFAAARKRGGDIISQIRHEMNPDVRTERYLKRTYDAMLAAGIDPEIAEEAVIKNVKKLLKKASDG